MGYSGPGGKLIHEKNQKQKSRNTFPLKYKKIIQMRLHEALS